MDIGVDMGPGTVAVTLFFSRLWSMTMGRHGTDSSVSVCLSVCGVCVRGSWDISDNG